MFKQPPASECVPHEYGPSRVGHGEAQCRWCLGTNRENAIIAPNHCDKRAKARASEQTEQIAETANCSDVVEDKLDRDWTKEKVHEVIDEGDGFWRPCSGCQESVDGYVSQNDYPYSELFRCQPGAGCGECGGIGVTWDDTDYEEYAKFALAATHAPQANALREAQRSIDPQTDPLVIAIEQAIAWFDEYAQSHAAKAQEAVAVDDIEAAARRRKSETNAQRAAYLRAALTESQTDAEAAK